MSPPNESRDPVFLSRVQRLLGAAGFPSRGLEYEMGLVRKGQAPPWVMEQQPAVLAKLNRGIGTVQID
jgi:hypothetical protein